MNLFEFNEDITSIFKKLRSNIPPIFGYEDSALLIKNKQSKIVFNES